MFLAVAHFFPFESELPLPSDDESFHMCAEMEMIGAAHSDNREVIWWPLMIHAYFHLFQVCQEWISGSISSRDGCACFSVPFPIISTFGCELELFITHTQSSHTDIIRSPFITSDSVGVRGDTLVFVLFQLHEFSHIIMTSVCDPSTFNTYERGRFFRLFVIHSWHITALTVSCLFLNKENQITGSAGK